MGVADSGPNDILSTALKSKLVAQLNGRGKNLEMNITLPL